MVKMEVQKMNTCEKQTVRILGMLFKVRITSGLQIHTFSLLGFFIGLFINAHENRIHHGNGTQYLSMLWK